MMMNCTTSNLLYLKARGEGKAVGNVRGHGVLQMRRAGTRGTTFRWDESRGEF